MKKTKNFNDKEWEELASLLSEEKNEQSGFLYRFQTEDIYNTSEHWNELRNLKSKEEINVEKAWLRVFDRLSNKKIRMNYSPPKLNILRSKFMRVAAIALIVLSLGATAIYLNNSGYLGKNNTVITDNDHKNLLIDLPDGSRIFLNRNTELSYSSNFGNRKREVKLNGEAFFEIFADASKPFLIDAGDAMVKVVGTSFNVITKNAESSVEVYVKSGKVILSDNSGSKSLIIDPEYVGTMNLKTSNKIVNTDPNYISWNTGLLVYNGQKLDVVFNDLKRVYNMDIVADDPEILENTWTSPIDNQSQDTIIRLICASFNLSYKKDGTIYHLTKK